MSKTLRLGFIMGGGVSLGSFSSAALCESIKQLLVYAEYEDTAGQKRPYARIEIDVLTGSSAGAISLGIMLRGLASPRDQYQLLGYNSYSHFRQELQQELLGQFGEAAYKMMGEQPEKFEDLLAIQGVQKLQEHIWAKEVNLDELLAQNKEKVKAQAGLLDRSYIDEMGHRYFGFPQQQPVVSQRRLLAPRVLFACTLSNLQALNLQGSPKGSPFGSALNDAEVYKSHAELRCFDLNFGEVREEFFQHYPIPWRQFHLGPAYCYDNKGQQKEMGSLLNMAYWQELSASCIASAAFPLAFEPVRLRRYRHELQDRWPEALAAEDSHIFTYVDGGMFNNEPIREAMRLGSYLDQLHKGGPDYDRLMLFVDPIVGEIKEDFQEGSAQLLGLQRSWLTGRAKWGARSPLARIGDKLPKLVSALLHESQQGEWRKIKAVVDRFEERKKLRQYQKLQYSGKQLPPQERQALRQFIEEELAQLRQGLYLPPAYLQLSQELSRILSEEQAFFADKLPWEDAQALWDSLYAYVEEQEIKAEEQAAWDLALSFLALDLGLGLLAKEQKAKIVGIAPFDFYRSETEPYGLLQLPGLGLSGFAGFASEAASRYEARYAAYCSFRILRELGYSSAPANLMQRPAAFSLEQFDPPLLNGVRDALLQRFSQLVPSEYRRALPFLEGFLSDSLDRFIEQNIGPKRKCIHIELRLHLAKDNYCLRGYNEEEAYKKNQLNPKNWAGREYIVTKIDYYPELQTWSGPNLGPNNRLWLDRIRLFNEQEFMPLPLPEIPEGHPAYLRAYPVFELDLRTETEIGVGRAISTQEWQLLPDPKSLDTPEY
ncbi:Patatin-like phospholipase [Saprospira grandis DSM 2844]|uniref:Patatin-like phospholipase n=2 Tax=Saprospira TaxID=1007 RepID=J0PAN9_9BACT|nr:Patatin-like phospholipase [Saprospira grandis DSM 2844]